MWTFYFPGMPRSGLFSNRKARSQLPGDVVESVVSCHPWSALSIRRELCFNFEQTPMSKCVLFDLDNTLVHRNESVNRYVDVLLADCRDVAKRFSRAEILRLILECDNGGYLRPGSPHA